MTIISIVLKLKGKLQYELPNPHPLINHSEFLLQVIGEEKSRSTQIREDSLTETGLLELIWLLCLNEDLTIKNWLAKYSTLLEIYKDSDKAFGVRQAEEKTLAEFREHLVGVCIPLCERQTDKQLVQLHINSLSVDKTFGLIYIDCTGFLSLSALEFWVQWFELDDRTSRSVALRHADYFAQHTRNSLKLRLPNSSYVQRGKSCLTSGGLFDQEYGVTHTEVIPWDAVN